MMEEGHPLERLTLAEKAFPKKVWLGRAGLCYFLKAAF